ncbi:MAG: hypothetical protein OEZ13_04880 [Spirochaetia bacterium]|nr:hypothetical protein [Spirochaetia bacterium]
MQEESVKKTSINLFVIFIFVFLIHLIVFAYLWRNIKVSTLKYEISRLEKEKRKLFLKSEKLRLTIAEYSTISRVEKLFRERYGYVPLEISGKISTLELLPVKIEPLDDEE